MSVGVYGDQEIVANGFCGTKWNKKFRRVKITFQGGHYIREVVVIFFASFFPKKKLGTLFQIINTFF